MAENSVPLIRHEWRSGPIAANPSASANQQQPKSAPSTLEWQLGGNPADLPNATFGHIANGYDQTSAIDPTSLLGMFTQPQASQPREIPVLIDRLENNLDAVTKWLHSLQERLEPVLQPCAQQGKGEQTIPRVATALGARLDLYCDRLAALEILLADLHRRLEL